MINEKGFNESKHAKTKAVEGASGQTNVTIFIAIPSF